ncbi:MAG: rhodanese-like domain-containing protein [Polaromonas sp.]|nr:rhodanese-like domain-containing protein [Polaromonas sp.]
MAALSNPGSGTASSKTPASDEGQCNGVAHRRAFMRFHAISLTKGPMDILVFFEQYWPFMALALWFAYKWWNSKRVVAMLPALRKDGATFVDVRSAGEFASGNAPGTINIPLQELGSRLGEIPKSSPVVLCCASGTRSGMAKLMLKRKGYQKVYNVGTWNKLLD